MDVSRLARLHCVTTAPTAPAHDYDRSRLAQAPSDLSGLLRRVPPAPRFPARACPRAGLLLLCSGRPALRLLAQCREFVAPDHPPLLACAPQLPAVIYNAVLAPCLCSAVVTQRAANGGSGPGQPRFVGVPASGCVPPPLLGLGSPRPSAPAQQAAAPDSTLKGQAAKSRADIAYPAITPIFSPDAP